MLAAASALAAIVLLIVFRKCRRLSGCGSRAVMEMNGLLVETNTEMEIDTEAESTIFKGMSAEEAEHKVEEGLRKAKQTTEEAEDDADADVNTDTDASADDTAEQESAEHTETTEEGEDDGDAN